MTNWKDYHYINVPYLSIREKLTLDAVLFTRKRNAERTESLSRSSRSPKHEQKRSSSSRPTRCFIGSTRITIECNTETRTPVLRVLRFDAILE